MIRPFHLRDIALMRRLGQQGVPLHTEAALTGKSDLLRNALRHRFIGGQFHTYIWKGENGGGCGFVHLQMHEDGQHTRLVLLGVRPPKSDSHCTEQAWLSLLDDLVATLGRDGVHSLVAEVNETGPELPIMRHASFAVYTRQDVWLLRHFKPADGLANLRRRQPTDDWDIHLLYANTVPRLVQLAEPTPPINPGQSWVLREGDELAAFVHISEGEAGVWLRFFLDPNVEAETKEVIAAVLSLKHPADGRPIYCCVPRYQSWMQSALEQTGFEYWASQAVMVRHTVQRMEVKSVPELPVMLESKAVRAGPTTWAHRHQWQGERVTS